MADGHFPTLVSATRDANAAGNPIFTQITDGTDLLSVNADGSINVTVTGGASNTQFAEDSAHVSGDIGTEMLSVRRDTPISGTSADGDYATLNTDANGRLYTQIHDGGNSITVDGTVTVTATDLDIRDLSHTQDSVRIGDGTDLANVTAAGELNVLATAQPGVDIGDVTINNAAGAAAVNIQDGGNSITVDGAVTVSATDLDIRDLNLTQDAVRVSANTSANSATNPIFVKDVQESVSSTEVHSYNTAAAVAADASSNHDYTVVGTTFLLKKVIGSFSGGGKIEIQTGPVASLVTIAVAFVPKEGGTQQIEFNPPREVPVTSTGTVRVIRTNRQGQAQDVYSTIMGNDLP